MVDDADLDLKMPLANVHDNMVHSFGMNYSRNGCNPSSSSQMEWAQIASYFYIGSPIVAANLIALR